ncbi:hypothetical protein [Paenibacillus sp. 1-18]|uniref:hypothetical protein n=1 Tax=Paenibacillus sp. 1-18 TaxID=1333846 RepID=UPI00046F173A|nr:hypothetical protein [Paenibacillus sp. 1-18]
MNENILSSLIDILQEIHEKDKKISDVFETTDIEFLNPIASKIENLILHELNVPEDNTVQMLKLHGDPEGYSHEDTFCRDFLGDWFMDYAEGEITKDELIHNLTNWKLYLQETD